MLTLKEMGIWEHDECGNKHGFGYVFLFFLFEKHISVESR